MTTAIPGPRAPLPEQCRSHARHAEGQAMLGHDPAMRAQLLGIAGQWRRLARMLDRLDDGPGGTRPAEPRSFAAAPGEAIGPARAIPPPMSNAPEDETPIQRALRLKQAAVDARPKPPRGGRFQREQSAKAGSGKSKPWVKR
jgi:hypothetical protein